MRFASVCSGIESASVAWHYLGWRAAWVAETDKACSKLLAKRFPGTPNHGDLTTLADRVRSGEVEPQPLLVGGTPCQDFSIAGLRKGMAGARGGLLLSYIDLFNAFDEMLDEPAVCVWENVPGVLSDKNNAFGHLLAGLAGEDVPLVPSGRKWTDAGVVCGPQRTVAWRCLDAQFFGLAQRRKRVFVVASARPGFDPGAVLLEFKGVRRDTPPSRETRESVAGTIAGGARVHGGYSTDDVPIVAAYGGGNCSGPIAAAAAALNANERYDFDSETFVCVTGDITHTLRAEAFDASEDGTGRGQPIVACGFNGRMDPCVYGDMTGSLDTDGGTQVVAYMPARSFGADGEVDTRYAEREISDALHTSTGSGNKAPVVLSVAYSIMPMNGGKDYKAREVEVAQPLMAGGPVGGNQGGDYVLQTRVRRLMPVECERLMGFPDGWTEGQADGPRYKQLGNSKAVSVVARLGRRIQMEMLSAVFQQVIDACNG